ncbi:MAG TPA: alpha/beta hydrolase [Vicinamibacterales bacterium]|nr:alpha/beta hydrolase [Vicinamibacterales bacterium]
MSSTASTSSAPVMSQFTSPQGIRVSYRKSGSGPPLVLVHGGFSNHLTNWEFVEPILGTRFTLYAIARRNRGNTEATQGHTLLDEARDVVALMEHIGAPVFLLGHSYGGQCALNAAHLAPASVRKLVLYEPPHPSMFGSEASAALEGLAARGDWEGFAFTFFRDTIGVPAPELEALRTSELWPPIVMDAPASLGDIRAVRAHAFNPAEYRGLPMPVCLQVGSESRHELYVTDALAAELPHAHLTVLHGQAHEGMTTAPEQYAAAVTTFLLG